MEDQDLECLWWISMGDLYDPPEICGLPLQEGRDLCPKHEEMDKIDRVD